MNYSRYFSLTIFVLAILTFTGCVSPQPISSLNALEDEATFWHQGDEILSETQDSITVEFTYKRQFDEHFIFDVAIYNESRTPLMVDPAVFYYQAVTTHLDTLKLVRAENPEVKLLDYDAELSRLEAREINHAVSSALIGAANITLTALATANETQEERDEELDRTIAENRYYREQEKVDIAYDMMSAEEQRAYWETETLRKTTLFPDQYITGRVFFKRKKDAYRLKFFLPVENHLFDFSYEHFLIPVY